MESYEMGKIAKPIERGRTRTEKGEPRTYSTNK